MQCAHWSQYTDSQPNYGIFGHQRNTGPMLAHLYVKNIDLAKKNAEVTAF